VIPGFIALACPGCLETPVLNVLRLGTIAGASLTSANAHNVWHGPDTGQTCRSAAQDKSKIKKTVRFRLHCYIAGMPHRFVAAAAVGSNVSAGGDVAHGTLTSSVALLQFSGSGY
jgi:hypothetical protein